MEAIDPRKTKPPITAWLAMSGSFRSLCKLIALIDRSQKVRLAPQQIDAIVDAVSWNTTPGSIFQMLIPSLSSIYKVHAAV